MSKLQLDRRTLAGLLQNNQQAIFAFERILGDVDGVLPSTIEEANALAGQALALVQVQGALLSLMAEALERLESAPAAPPQLEPDDTAPRTHLGTIASQDADAVDITGGTAALAELTLSGQMTSTVATGAPPLVVDSTDKVDNLYVDRAALADKLGAPTTFPAVATDLPTAITLVNALRAAGILKGL
jgi:hypothetical protein